MRGMPTFRVTSSPSATKKPANETARSNSKTCRIPMNAPQAASIFKSPAPAARTRNGSRRKRTQTPAASKPSRSPAVPPHPNWTVKPTARPPNVQTLGRRRVFKSLMHSTANHGVSSAARRIVQEMGDMGYQTYLTASSLASEKGLFWSTASPAIVVARC